MTATVDHVMNSKAAAALPSGDQDWGRSVASGKDKADENFPVGSLLIARRLRPHVHAYYAFARAIDDIADNAVLSAEQKIERLDAMEALLLGRRPARDGLVSREEAAIASALQRSLDATGINPARATDLLIAFRRDARAPRTASLAELLDYCRYSANPVGLYLLDLHGEGAASHAASDALCTALQILNHLQDCQDDLVTLGRSYLPEAWLAEQGETVDSVRRTRASPGLRRVLDRLLDEVDRLNRIAAGLAALIADRRMRMEAAVIVGASQRLARRLRHADPLAGRVKLTRSDVARSAISSLRHVF
jgi:squalene synthase HpnC